MKYLSLMRSRREAGKIMVLCSLYFRYNLTFFHIPYTYDICKADKFQIFLFNLRSFCQFFFKTSKPSSNSYKIIVPKCDNFLLLKIFTQEISELQEQNAKHLTALKTFSLKKLPITIQYTSFIIHRPYNYRNATNNPGNKLKFRFLNFEDRITVSMSRPLTSVSFTYNGSSLKAHILSN